MATITIRNLPDEVVARLKDKAACNGRSMEEEVRLLLRERYASRAEIIKRVRARWDRIGPVTPEEVEGWIAEGRP